MQGNQLLNHSNILAKIPTLLASITTNNEDNYKIDLAQATKVREAYQVSIDVEIESSLRNSSLSDNFSACFNRVSYEQNLT